MGHGGGHPGRGQGGGHGEDFDVDEETAGGGSLVEAEGSRRKAVMHSGRDPPCRLPSTFWPGLAEVSARDTLTPKLLTPALRSILCLANRVARSCNRPWPRPPRSPWPAPSRPA